MVMYSNKTQTINHKQSNKNCKHFLGLDHLLFFSMPRSLLRGSSFAVSRFQKHWIFHVAGKGQVYNQQDNNGVHCPGPFISSIDTFFAGPLFLFRLFDQ
jgi:hypothetical protein